MTCACPLVPSRPLRSLRAGRGLEFVGPSPLICVMRRQCLSVPSRSIDEAARNMRKLPMTTATVSPVYSQNWLPPGLPAINTPPIHATVAQKTCALLTEGKRRMSSRPDTMPTMMSAITRTVGFIGPPTR